MASTLPHHILTYIGIFIDREDRPHCALVCKHWTDPFLNAYWGRLYIHNDNMNIDTVISNKSLMINAHRVWAMVFQVFHFNLFERLLELQRSFPGIRYFEYQNRPLKFSISAALDWSLWQSLTHINIVFGHDSEAEPFQSLFMKLSVLPCLVHLTLLKSHPPNKHYSLSWNDFEDIHYHLPRLEYLRHQFPSEPITKDEIESIKAVEPAQTMTKIEFNDYIDTHWLFYFALKYPNLQHFNIKQCLSRYNINRIDYNKQHYQQDLQLLSTLDQFFPCLKRADTTFKDNNECRQFIFFETLGHFGTKIEHVDLYYYSCMKDDDVNRCIQPISESLKVLQITVRPREGIHFGACSRLVTLYICGWEKITITPDQILESFPALRSLSFTGTKISLSTNPHTYTPHPLQRLTIKRSYITNDAIHYLSLCCNQLKHLKLIDIRYNGIGNDNYKDEDNDEVGQLFFDMPMSNLDTFIFTFMDQLLHEYKVFPKHYMIEQMENDNEIVQATQQSPRINWYHTYCDRTNRKETISKWELGRRDIEFCQRYFKDFDRRRKRGKERKDIKKNRLGYKQKRFWKKDLQHGVLVFRFKSVKNHFFGIRSDSGFSEWEKIKRYMALKNSQKKSSHSYIKKDKKIM
ncbi:hypothetical protein CLU79DRAFT_564039 [Phycomyces nitens]|nr:hypothetical protein CLU79DRAFT_564039 [Phycomyces nitens]